MRTLCTALLLLASVTAAAGSGEDKAGDEGKKPAPKLPLGKETTYVTEPLDKDGHVDYESALNKRISAGVKPDDTANVLLWKVFGPKKAAAMPPGYFRALGVAAPGDGDYFLDLSVYLQERVKLDEKQLVA